MQLSKLRTSHDMEWTLLLFLMHTQCNALVMSLLFVTDDARFLHCQANFPSQETVIDNSFCPSLSTIDW